MKKNRRLTKRELKVMELYANCSLSMTPQKFYEKWPLTHEQIGFICKRATSTVGSWYRHGSSYRHPQKNDLRNLALMDFLLEHYEQIPAEFRNLLCPSKRDS